MVLIENLDMTPKTTIEQWVTLLAVVECGSFTKAAERLNKSQSSISYAIKCLQDRIPVKILENYGRKVALTDEGKVLLQRAKEVILQTNALEATAKRLESNWEAEITIAVDSIFPRDVLFQAISDFEPSSNGCRLLLKETFLSSSEEAILNKSADIAIAAEVPIGHLGRKLLNTGVIAVASPCHPLHRLPTILESDMRQYRQIVIKDDGVRRNQNKGWLQAAERWTVSSFLSAIEVVERGLAFGWLPESYIRTNLLNGSLVPLKLGMMQFRSIECHMVFPNAGSAPGPALELLSQQLVYASETYKHIDI
ncbi:LysR family transcriptional regulator [Vibrio harveyi]|uniref:LysR family transcriptional regulator n=1 Tax=Vibrio harveyi TaxID=669 RepID=UPI000C7D6533|nr:LysR family transcriptional regulator [Vibrio harveyi]